MIKPCPFCGNDKGNLAYCVDDGWQCRSRGKTVWAVECGGCTCEGPWAEDWDDDTAKALAIKLWNKRSNNEPN